MNQKSIHVLIRGRVQGVGFRGFVRHQAEALGIKGWARNLSNGGVEAVFSGDDAAVDAMVEACRRGPSGALVAELKVEPYTGAPETRFEIRSTV